MSSYNFQINKYDHPETNCRICDEQIYYFYTLNDKIVCRGCYKEYAAIFHGFPILRPLDMSEFETPDASER